MADKIHSYYLKAEEMGGVKARAKLSMLTTVDSHQSKSIPDSEENIRIFEKAMKKVVKEFNSGDVEEETRLKVIKLLLAKLAS